MRYTLQAALDRIGDSSTAADLLYDLCVRKDNYGEDHFKTEEEEDEEEEVIYGE